MDLLELLGTTAPSPPEQYSELPGFSFPPLRSLASPRPDLKSGTFERAAPTAADPKEKLPSASVEGCFGDGSRSRIGNPKRPGSAPETSGRDCPIPRGVGFPSLSVALGALQIPTGVAFPAPGAPVQDLQ